MTRIATWRRLRFTLLVAVPFGLLLGAASLTPITTWIARTMTVGLLAMLVYGSFEQSPTRLPPWLARWVLQLLGVVVAVPIGAFIAYWATTGGNLQFLRDPLRLVGYAQLCVMGILFAPWVALGAMVRQRDATARAQALTFQLERSEFERRDIDARLRLLQAQVQPHFLFNTLANIRALVTSGSPQLPGVLDSLIAYLRAAVPRFADATATIGDELRLVQAYLELMQMRMPDRLLFSVQVDDTAAALTCPPMMLMTLVENAVRHGIDPSEDGGRIDVLASVNDGRCGVRVVDTGVGMRPLQRRDDAGTGTGTGLVTLRERLRLAYGADASLHLHGNTPRGVSAEIVFPAVAGAAGAP